MQLPSDNYLKWFDKHGQSRPSHQPHIREDEIPSNMEKIMPTKWHQEGNQLIGITPDGTRVVQTIPTNYLLQGTDKKGLPTFTKL